MARRSPLHVLTSWLARPHRPRRRPRLGVESLEDRTTPAVYTVTGLADGTGAVTPDGAGGFTATTLRAAVTAADADPAADTIVFGPALTATGPATVALSIDGDDTFGPSALRVTTPITIKGTTTTGANGITLARDAAAAPDRLRLFYVAAGGSLTLADITLSGGLARGGNAAGNGGGAAGLGGAVVNAGALTLLRATLTDNLALGGSSTTSTYLSRPNDGGGGGLGGDSVAGGNGGGPTGGSNGVDGTPTSPSGPGAPGGAGGFGGGGGSSAVRLPAVGGDGGFGGGGGGSLAGGLSPAGRAGAGGFGGGGGGGGTFSLTVAPSGEGGFGGGHGGESTPSLNRLGAGGGGAGLGGAVFNYGGTISITDSTLANNTARGGASDASNTNPGEDGKGYGGAVFNLNGTVTVLNSTLAYNVAADGGGAVFNLGSGAQATQAGPALPVREATVTLTNSILSNSAAAAGGPATTDYQAATTPGQFSTPAQSSGGTNNLIGSSVGFGGSTIAFDPVTQPPLVGTAPAANGGPTRTFALAPGSPAVDAGSDTAAAGLSADQRGYRRRAGGAVDVGAYESASLPAVIPATLVVDATADEQDGDYTPGHLSLREAVFLANADPDANTITFAPALAAAGPASVLLELVGDTTFGVTALAVTSPVTIQGPTGPNGVTIGRSYTVGFLRLFYVAPGASLTLQDVSVVGGYAQGRSGGRYAVGGRFVYSNGGGAAGLGGAVVNAGTLNLVRATLEGNLAWGAGGGYGVDSGPGASGGGGGLGVTTAGGDADGTAGGGPNGGTPGGGAGGFGGGGGSSGGAGGFGAGGGGGDGLVAVVLGGAGGFGGGGGNSPNGVGGRGGFGGGDGATGAGMGGGGGAGLGGAIFNYGGTVTIADSTLTGNAAIGGLAGPGGTDAAGYGGAVFNLNGTVAIVNSTLADNIASTDGGAVFNLRSGGEATQGGPALPVQPAVVTLTNTILAYSRNGFGRGGQGEQGGPPPAQPVNDYAGAVTAGTGATPPPPDTGGASNIVQRNAGFAGTDTLVVDPLLGPLDDYGGPTRVYPLRTGSPAVDAGTAAGAPAVDQRGQPRPQGAGVDLGAFEVPAAPVAVAVGPPALPAGRAGDGYAATLTASGSNAVFAFAVTAGALPAGLTLSADGVLSGTPTAAGAFGFTVTASSPAGSGSRAYVLTVASAPVDITVSPAALPGGRVGDPYDQALAAAAGAGVTGPFTFAVLDGELPRGLGLSADGRITGTPTVPGTYTLTVKVTAAAGGLVIVPYAVTVAATPGAPLPPTATGPTRLTVTRRDGGLPSDLVVRNPDGSVRFNLAAFELTWAGDVNLAVGDLNGDGVDDVAVGAGLGGSPRLEVYDGATGARMSNDYMFDARLTGGVKVEIAGDELVVTPGGTGVAPHVRVFRGGSEVASFYAFARSFPGGVNMAAGDVTGDGVADVVFGAATGGGPAVVVFDGATGAFRAAYFAGPGDDRGGVEVAVRDLDGDGRNEVVARAAGTVRVYDPLTGLEITPAFDPAAVNAVFA